MPSYYALAASVAGGKGIFGSWDELIAAAGGKPQNHRKLATYAEACAFMRIMGCEAGIPAEDPHRTAARAAAGAAPAGRSWGFPPAADSARAPAPFAPAPFGARVSGGAAAGAAGVSAGVAGGGFSAARRAGGVGGLGAAEARAPGAGAARGAAALAAPLAPPPRTLFRLQATAVPAKERGAAVGAASITAAPGGRVWGATIYLQRGSPAEGLLQLLRAGVTVAGACGISELAVRSDNHLVTSWLRKDGSVKSGRLRRLVSGVTSERAGLRLLLESACSPVDVQAEVSSSQEREGAPRGVGQAALAATFFDGVAAQLGLGRTAGVNSSNSLPLGKRKR